MKFRFRYRIMGGYVHIRMFAGAPQSYGKCGDLRMRQDEWGPFQEAFRANSPVEFVHEDEEVAGCSLSL